MTLEEESGVERSSKADMKKYILEIFTINYICDNLYIVKNTKIWRFYR